eukprot:Trichotokara_eunicae@DN11203_c0_g1_i1.p1
MILGILRIMFGLLGIASVLMQWKMGCVALTVGLRCFVTSMVLTLIIRWIEWGLRMGGVGRDDKWKPTTENIIFMVLFTLAYIIFLCIVWFLFSMVKSLMAVFDAGGSGWEKMNRHQVKDHILNKKAERIVNADPKAKKKKKKKKKKYSALI